jgi:DNA-binding Lrp family transcriptional regulator
LKGYTTIVDSVKLGYAFTAVILIQVEGKHLAEVEKEIAQLNQTVCVYDICGDFDITVVAKFRSRFAMNRFIKDMKSMSHVRRAVTSLVFNVVKEDFKVSARYPRASPNSQTLASLHQKPNRDQRREQVSECR